jgi:hypothetical protein
MADPWSYAAKTRNEFAEQSALFMWANMAARFGPVIADDPNSYIVAGFAKTQFENAGKIGYKVYSAPIPELEFLHAIHNQGTGDAIRGARAKAEGVKAGAPDMSLPVPRYPGLLASRLISSPPYSVPQTSEAYAGLYIELKRLKSDRGAAGKASDVQTKWHNFLACQGYKVVLCEGWEAARAAILAYLGR